MTIDIPDHLYSRLEAKATIEGSTARDIIVGLVRRELQASQSGTRVRFPLIKGKGKKKLRITSEQIDRILFGV
jgi:hypothetical protein